MDRTLARVLGALLVAVVVTVAVISLAHYAVSAYGATLRGTYEYRVSISPGAPLENVTLYLPIPSMGAEKSAVAEEIGAGGLRGIPPGWGLSLIGTEKVTMLEITARDITPRENGEPYLLSVRAVTPGPVETRKTATRDLVIDTLAGKAAVPCGDQAPVGSPKAVCLAYRGRIYAFGTAGENSRLHIALALTGKNTWDVFGPSSNEYRDGLAVTITGAPRGWYEGDGMLVTGIGDYGMEFWVKQP